MLTLLRHTLQQSTDGSLTMTFFWNPTALVPAIARQAETPRRQSNPTVVAPDHSLLL